MPSLEFLELNGKEYLYLRVENLRVFDKNLLPLFLFVVRIVSNSKTKE